LYSGLLWVRENTDQGSVLVVNNHSLRPDGTDSKYFYYSAFSQRRVVLESWDYTAQTAALGVFSLAEAETPFPRRLRLSRAVFATADPEALRILRCDYGATHLLVDNVHGTATPEIGALGTLVYGNDEVRVYRITARTSSPTRAERCSRVQSRGPSGSAVVAQ
jgi:hypothetical protein